VSKITSAAAFFIEEQKFNNFPPLEGSNWYVELELPITIYQLPKLNCRSYLIHDPKEVLIERLAA
jgi:hypothetical protein